MKQPSSEVLAVYAFGGYGEKCHICALQLARWSPKHIHTSKSGRKSACLQSSQSQSRVLSAQSRLSGYRNSTPAIIYALAALASSMSRAMRCSPPPSCNISHACSLRSTSRHPCFRVRGIRGWSDMYQPIGYALWHNQNQHEAISSLQTMSQWSIQSKHTNIRSGRRWHREPRLT